MKSRCKLFGHPLHTMLVVFPLGLLVTSVIFDVLHLLTKRREQAVVANRLVGAGVLGGVVAALPGLIDWLSIPPGTKAKRVGAWHALGNIKLLLFFAYGWKLRKDHAEKTGDEAPPKSALALSLTGLLIGNITAWLGGELVYRYGVGMEKPFADGEEVLDS